MSCLTLCFRDNLHNIETATHNDVIIPEDKVNFNIQQDYSRGNRQLNFYSRSDSKVRHAAAHHKLSTMYNCTIHADKRGTVLGPARWQHLVSKKVF